MRVLMRVLVPAAACAALVLACGGDDSGSEGEYIIGDVLSIHASMPLGGGEMTIQSVTLFDLGDAPDASIPEGAENLAAEMFANGDLAEDATASARRVSEGPDDDSIDDDEYILAKVKVDDPARYEAADTTADGDYTGWVSLEGDTQVSD